VSFVSYIKFSVPPSLGSPRFTAIASINVDLPTPFSPTKNVTGELSLSFSKSLTIGMLKGYLS